MSLLGIGAIVTTVGKLADDLITTDKERLEAELEAYRAETDRLSGQIEINKVEAQHSSIFVAGWRPASGWICVLALAYQFILYPLLVWGWSAMQAAGWIPGGLTPPPLLDVEALMVLITGMLGIAGARSFEKIKGVAR